MQFTKKIVAVVAGVAMCAGLTACGGSRTGQSGDGDKIEKGATIGISMPNDDVSSRPEGSRRGALPQLWGAHAALSTHEEQTAPARIAPARPGTTPGKDRVKD